MSKYKPEDLRKMKEFVQQHNYKDKVKLLRKIDNQNFYGDYYNLFCQIQSMIGLYDNSDDMYEVMLSKIKKNFDINVPILELCCGHYPALATKIRKMQTKAGSITAYDRCLVINNIEGITLIKDDFRNCNIDMNKYKLIVAQKPVLLYDKIVELAIKSKTDFIINPSPCMVDLPRLYDIGVSLYDAPDESIDPLGGRLCEELEKKIGSRNALISSFYDYTNGSYVMCKFRK